VTRIRERPTTSPWSASGLSSLHSTRLRSLSEWPINSRSLVKDSMMHHYPQRQTRGAVSLRAKQSQQNFALSFPRPWTPGWPPRFFSQHRMHVRHESDRRCSSCATPTSASSTTWWRQRETDKHEQSEKPLREWLQISSTMMGGRTAGAHVTNHTVLLLGGAQEL
jgi:hypothetical protein